MIEHYKNMSTCKKGIIYFNTGRKCLVRLIVSLYSLRKVYDGNLSLLTSGEDEPEYDIISKTFNLNIIKNKHIASEGENRVYLEKCLTHLNTPYDTTIWLDADTIILKDPSEDLWRNAEENEFAISQFSTWTTQGGRIGKRIRSWEKIYPEYIEEAIKFGSAINCGVISFQKTSKLMMDWYELAIKGRYNFIPDESCCQLILHRYPHIILDDKYNTSCKYSKIHEDTFVIHYHGRKHCRLDENNNPIYNADIWLKYYNECIELNICDIQNLVNTSDRMLKRFIKNK